MGNNSLLLYHYLKSKFSKPKEGEENISTKERERRLRAKWRARDKLKQE